MLEPLTTIDMVLFCPKCGMQHIDRSDVDKVPVRLQGLAWDNPPHRSHLCRGCGHIWRPADVPTNGVEAVRTKGANDSPLVAPAPPAISLETIAEWRAERGRGMCSAIGEYTPAEFWTLLDAYEAIAYGVQGTDGGAAAGVPTEVLAAVERMKTPLHESRLSGATAVEDARCMKVIADFIASLAASPVAGVPTDELLNKLIELGAQAAMHNAKANSDDGHAGTEAQGKFYAVRNEIRALLSAGAPAVPLQDCGHLIGQAVGDGSSAPTQPVAMIEPVDARKLADELEKLRCDHWARWSAQENHIAATAVRHLRLLGEQTK
jgi:hypothetical protein